jgi:hypothetical protein
MLNPLSLTRAVCCFFLLCSFGSASAEELRALPMPQLLDQIEQRGNDPMHGELALSAVGVMQNPHWAAKDIDRDLRLAQRPSGGTKTIRCESRGERYEYCRTSTRGRVRLERQLSSAPCRQYSTWGTDGDGSGIWVRNGCRGIFVVEEYRHTYPDNWWGWGRTVTCKSERFRYNHCTVDRRGRRVRLERQLSDTPCRRGETWGLDREGIWVDRGCAAVFTIQ